MKSVSLVLRIVAILGALACVALWFNTKGIIKKATNNMVDVEGVTLIQKSANVPGILEESAKTKSDLASTSTKLSDAEKKVKDLASNLETERASNDRINRELVKNQTEMRKLKISIEDLQKALTKEKSTVAALKNEIATNDRGDEIAADLEALKQKYNALNIQYTALQSEYAVAKKKADLLDISVIVEEKSIDREKGIETTIKHIYPPFVEKGEVAVVTKVRSNHDLIMLNRGKDNGLGEKQLIDLKNEKTGELIAQVTVVGIGPDFAVVSVNPKLGKPETIESGDSLMLVPTVDFKSGETSSEETAAPAQSDIF